MVRALRIDLAGAARKTLADIDPAADRAAVARTGADAERAPLEDDRRDAVPRQFQRRREPGIAAADDRDARLARHVGEFAGNRRIRLPPIRQVARNRGERCRHSRIRRSPAAWHGRRIEPDHTPTAPSQERPVNRPRSVTFDGDGTISRGAAFRYFIGSRQRPGDTPPRRTASAFDKALAAAGGKPMERKPPIERKKASDFRRSF